MSGKIGFRVSVANSTRGNLRIRRRAVRFKTGLCAVCLELECRFARFGVDMDEEHSKKLSRIGKRIRACLSS